MAECTKTCVVFLYLQIICTIYNASTTNAYTTQMNVDGRGLRTGDVIFVEGVLLMNSSFQVILAAPRSACRLTKNITGDISPCLPLQVMIDPRQSTVDIRNAIKTEINVFAATRTFIDLPSVRPLKKLKLTITVGERNYTIKVNDYSVTLPDRIGKRYVRSICFLDGNLIKYFLKNKHGNPISRSCGLRPGFNAGRFRVIGGTHLGAAEIPWQAALRNKEHIVFPPFRHVCAATLIDSCWVLTAAPCVTSTQITQQSLYVRVGDYYDGEDERYSQFQDTQDFEIEEIIVHPQYNFRNLINGVALIKLQSNSSDGTCARYSNFVQPICLPSPSDDFLDSSTCVVSGWGATVSFQGFTQYLHYPLIANVTIQNHKQCKLDYERYQRGRYPLPNHTVCASSPEVDTCQGDRGSPLSCSHSANGHFIMWGMESWQHRCHHPTVPSVFIKISSFVDWIERTMSRHS